MWATRCFAESKLWQRNAFITLTYDEENFPMHGSLNYSHFQLFMKRLRKANAKAGKPPFRFFMCGEYGENLGRPHYHALLFNMAFDDAVKCNSVYSVEDVYRSEMLSRAWGKGFATIGEVTYASARYVASYTIKLHNNMGAGDTWYERVDTATGELVELKPEFAQMSLKPGIGLRWLEKYWREVYTHNAVIVNGEKNTVPRYFHDKFKDLNPFAAEEARITREEAGRKTEWNSTPERLLVRETVARARYNFYEEMQR